LTTFNTENYKDEYIIARSCHGLVLTQFFNFSGEVEHLQRAFDAFNEVLDNITIEEKPILYASTYMQLASYYMYLANKDGMWKVTINVFRVCKKVLKFIHWIVIHTIMLLPMLI